MSPFLSLALQPLLAAAAQPPVERSRGPFTAEIIKPLHLVHPATKAPQGEITERAWCIAAGDELVALCGPADHPESEADARRIAAALNVVAGLKTSSIEADGYGGVPAVLAQNIRVMLALRDGLRDAVCAMVDLQGRTASAAQDEQLGRAQVAAEQVLASVEPYMPQRAAEVAS